MSDSTRPYSLMYIAHRFEALEARKSNNAKGTDALDAKNVAERHPMRRDMPTLSQTAETSADDKLANKKRMADMRVVDNEYSKEIAKRALLLELGRRFNRTLLLEYNQELFWQKLLVHEEFVKEMLYQKRVKVNKTKDIHVQEKLFEEAFVQRKMVAAFHEKKMATHKAVSIKDEIIREVKKEHFNQVDIENRKFEGRLERIDAKAIDDGLVHREMAERNLANAVDLESLNLKLAAIGAQALYFADKRSFETKLTEPGFRSGEKRATPPRTVGAELLTQTRKIPLKIDGG